MSNNIYHDRYRTTKKNGAPKDSPAEKVLNVLIIIMIFILVLAGVSFVREYREYGQSSFTEEQVISRVTYGDYASVVDYFYEGWDYPEDDAKKEAICALAKYINAAFMKHGFEGAGLSEKAAAEQQKMEEYAAKLGMFASEKEKIDARIYE